MSKPWGKIGAWAADSEAAEAEELAAAAAVAPAETFPGLREAAATKNKKKTKMSFQEFTMATSTSRLTPEEIPRLPTGPKERSLEEMHQRGRLGGGFSNYGGGPAHPREDRDSYAPWGGGGRRSYGGGFEHDDRGWAAPPRVLEFDNFPSRADEADNWTMGKKNLPTFDSGRPNRYTSLGSSGGIGPGGSRADNVDNWGAWKRATALAPPPGRSIFGSSFRDAGPGGSERPRLVLDSPKKDAGVTVVGPVRANKPNPFGAARPREEVLAEKGLDWKKMELEIEAKKMIRPTSSHVSRLMSSQLNQSEGVGVDTAVKARLKVNPFGDAKPREVLLQERGLDWRKIDLDLDHCRVDRAETEAEKILKEEIDHLKKELAKHSISNATRESHEGATEDLHNIIKSKERDLELLILELDDKIRFGPRVIERPGSGAGRVSGPHSWSGSFNESRNIEFMVRPRSHGTRDMWSRQSNDKRAFQGGMERRFMGNRGMDRPRSRDRW